jgi:inhibitor of cysteine peptidase
MGGEMMNAKIKQILYTTFLLFALLLVTGCTGAVSEPGTVELNDGDNGKIINLSLGQILIISLGSNPTTGYSWEVAEIDGAVLEQKGEALFEDEAPEGTPLVGAGGTETFKFSGVAEGETTLKLIYHRPWEEGVEPLEIYLISVNVKG